MSTANSTYFERARTELIRIRDAFKGSAEDDHLISHPLRMSGPEIGTTADGLEAYGAYRRVRRPDIREGMKYIAGGRCVTAAGAGNDANDFVIGRLPRFSHVIVTPDNLYSGTRNLLQSYFNAKKINLSFVDCTREALEQAAKKSSKRRPLAIFTEPLTNPLMKISDLQLIADFAEEQRKRRTVITIADNTMAPFLIQPFDYGFDIVTHSLTKYISGNREMGGSVNVNEHPSDIVQEMQMGHDGALARKALHPAAADNIVNHMPDFPVNLEEHCRNAFALANFFEGHSEIEAVYYPGLEKNPEHKRALQYMKHAFGGLVTFKLRGNAETRDRFITALENTGTAVQVTYTDSFGDKRTFVNSPDLSPNLRDLPAGTKRRWGYGESDVRVAVGLGDESRIIEPFAVGLDRLSHG